MFTTQLWKILIWGSDFLNKLCYFFIHYHVVSLYVLRDLNECAEPVVWSMTTRGQCGSRKVRNGLVGCLLGLQSSHIHEYNHIFQSLELWGDSSSCLNSYLTYCVATSTKNRTFQTTWEKNVAFISPFSLKKNKKKKQEWCTLLWYNMYKHRTQKQHQTHYASSVAAAGRTQANIHYKIEIWSLKRGEKLVL